MCSGVDYISEDFAFGEVARKDGIVWLLFSSMSSRRSVETVISYARSAGAECLMGHKVNVRFDVVPMRY